MIRKFVDCKINLGGNVIFPHRMNILSKLITSKVLRECAKDEKIPLYAFIDGKRVMVGYVKDIKGKLTTRLAGGSTIYLFADLLFTTNDDWVLNAAKTCINPHKNSYRLKFVKSDFNTNPDNIIYGLIVEFYV